ncbi:MAG: MarC family protein [Alphaproteobacteria bacterium]|nr:MarC family protein [Alphaproteobacteria bacterium]
MTEALISVFVTLFVVIDPIGVAPLFMSLTPTETAVERRKLALKGIGIGAAILFVFGIYGEILLETLGIGMPAFRIAGGILLVLLSIDMLMARDSGLRNTTDDEAAEGTKQADISVFPLAIPLVAGPGAMTSIVLLMGKAEGDRAMQGAILGTTAIVLLLSLLCLLAASTLMKMLGVTGVNVITRVFGIITAALGVQFVIDGVLVVLS